MAEVAVQQRHRRIAMLVSSMGRGGAERVAATLCNAWSEQGHDVWLIPTFLGDKEVSFELDKRVRLAFLSERPTALPDARRGPFWKVVELGRWLREMEPDVVVSFLPNVNVLALLATMGARFPVIVCERADPAAGVEMSLGLHVARFLLYPFASTVVVQTSRAALRLRRRLPLCRKMVVIPNPLPQRIAGTPPDSPGSREAGLVIAVGRLSPEKGYDLLLQAFGMAFQDLPSWRLEIWGDGPLRESLRDVIATLGLTGRARLRGATPDPWREMSRAQVFVLTSQYEGFPNAMMEAMALGVATVAFDCNSGPQDLTDGGRVGVLVPPGDVTALARELRSLAADDVRRRALGDAGAEYVRRSFSEHGVLARWDAVFSGGET